MHRDRKLGLGLGILLVGVVAAFFFRHQADLAPSVPALSDAESLDRQIDARDVAPYPDTAADPASPAVTPPADEAWDAPEFLTDDGAEHSPPPNPIPVRPTATSETSTGSPEAIPEHNRAWQALDEIGGARSSDVRGAAPAAENTPTGPAADGLVRHRVVPGDTLSGLAARYLGSSARFLEIYEANRDVLRSPNDLRVGMTLRIPARREPPPPRPESARTVRVSETDPGASRSSAGDLPPTGLSALPAIDRREFERGASPGDPPGGSESRLRFEAVRRSPLARQPRSGPARDATDPEPVGREPSFGAPTVDLLPPEEMFAGDGSPDQ